MGVECDWPQRACLEPVGLASAPKVPFKVPF